MTGSVATIGFFDGVHLGHRFVIGCVAAEARRRGLQAVVVTFDRHPREVLTGDGPGLLTSLEDKRRLIVEAGADRCEVLHFNRELAALSAREFMKSVLCDGLDVRVLLLGYDNRFGRREKSSASVSLRRESVEGFEDYVAYGRELGIEVMQMDKVFAQACVLANQTETLKEKGGAISSSAIREALRTGDVAQANTLLGRLYSMTGTVVHGFSEGHKLGFPTANLSTKTIRQLIPGRGVYLVKVTKCQGDKVVGLSGMMNIGMRPTFGGEEMTVEVNVFGFDGNLYGEELRVEVVQRIREERHFSSPEELRRQLEQDRAVCMELIERNKI